MKVAPNGDQACKTPTWVHPKTYASLYRVVLLLERLFLMPKITSQCLLVYYHIFVQTVRSLFSVVTCRGIVLTVNFARLGNFFGFCLCTLRRQNILIFFSLFFFFCHFLNKCKVRVLCRFHLFVWSVILTSIVEDSVCFLSPLLKVSVVLRYRVTVSLVS